MSELRQFELLEDLRPFGNARAVLLAWNGARYVVTKEEVQLFEFTGRYGDRRERGFARYSSESMKWEMVSGLNSPAASWMPY